jgi:hypothetical protein
MATMYLRGIPEDLKQKFKTLCMLRGKTMTEEIVRLMIQEVDKSSLGKL